MYKRNKYSHELQNKEFTDYSGLELYDYGARMQDPQLGRFWQIDPKCEIFRHYNPYNYCFNNLVLFIDPGGMKAVYNWEGPNQGQYTDDGKVVSWDEVQRQYQLGDYSSQTTVFLTQEYQDDSKRGLKTADPGCR